MTGEPAPIRILHVLPDLTSGGMERATVRLAAGVARLGFEQAVASVGGSDLELRRQLPPSVAVYDRLGGRRGLHRLIRSYRPHVVHARSTGMWLDATLAVRGGGARLLLSYHGRTGLERPTLRRRLACRAALSRADAVLAVSREAAEGLSAEYPPCRDLLRVIHNAVDTQLYRPDRQRGSALRTQLRAAGDEPLLVCVANLAPIKGHEVLLRAWAKLSQAGTRGRLLLVGEGPREGELRRLAVELGCSGATWWLGPRSDVPDLLNAADLFVLPSRYEACSNALLEAFGCGLAVVATRVGGNPELVSDGEDGLLVAPDDPEALAVAMSRLLADAGLRRRLGEQARRTVEQRFALPGWVSRYADLYRELAGTACLGTQGAAACAV